MNATSLDVDESIRSDLDEHDRVVLYPTFGHLSADGRSWHIAVSGVVFEPGRRNLRRRMVLRVLQRLMRVPADELRSDLFQDRISCFLVETERGKRIAIRMGDRVQLLQRPSKRNGHFRGSLQLAPHEVERHLGDRTTDNGWLNFGVLTGENQPERFAGEAQLIGQTGLSVISDIDDTIKASEVSDRRLLLQNTFLRKFQPVQGMSAIYQQWAEQGAAFHYVSSSPWQLYSSLKELLRDSGFPNGSFHLRSIRLRDPSILQLLFTRRSGKRRVIRSIVRMFPYRQFVLIGDSGERDPEIYGDLSRAFPKQIRQVYIRRVTGRPLTRDRLNRAFRDVPRSKWRIFDEPSEIVGV